MSSVCTLAALGGTPELRANEPLTADQLVRASGTIFCDGAVRGSGAHIQHALNDYSIIVTAAHVLFDHRIRRAFKECWFRSNNSRFEAVAFAQISKKLVSSSDRPAVQRSENDLVFIALKRKLYAPALQLKAQRPPMLGAGDLPAMVTPLAHIGYHAATDKMRLAKRCKTIATPYFYSKQLLLHDCQTGPGASGGALINDHDQSLVAVHGGTLYIDGSQMELRQGAHEQGDRGDKRPGNDPMVLQSIRLQIRQGRAVDDQVLRQLDDFINELRLRSD